MRSVTRDWQGGRCIIYGLGPVQGGHGDWQCPEAKWKQAVIRQTGGPRVTGTLSLGCGFLDTG